MKTSLYSAKGDITLSSIEEIVPSSGSLDDVITLLVLS